MAKKTFVRDNVPLSRFGVLVAQLESIVASAVHQPPDALLCFDLLSDLFSAIDDEPKESILLWQRKCEDALYSLLTLGARRPVRHLASVSMARIILKGDSISIYSRTSTLQGFLSDGKKSEPMRVAGAAQCLGELYSLFGRRVTSGMLETANISAKLMKFNEDYVRQEALLMLKNAVEGSGGNAAISAYIEAFRLVMRTAVSEKSVIVRVAAARCLNAFANIGGPGLGIGELDNAASCCVKALEDPETSVRDAFAEALGAILALGMNTNAQVQQRGRGQLPQTKTFEGGLQRHLVLPFMKAAGARSKQLRIGLTFSWVSLLQALRMKYLQSDSELQNFALQVMGMLGMEVSIDAQALACVLYILRVGITDQMGEPTQRAFVAFLAKQLQASDTNSSMEVAALRTISYLLKILGEVPLEFKEVLDDTVVAAVSRSSLLVRIEAALTLRTLAEADPTCVAGLASFGTTTIYALRENLSFEKGSSLKANLDSLHGQATVLAALVSISPKLPLGYPASLPKSVLQLSKAMLTEYSRNPEAAAVEEQAGFDLLSSLLASMPKEELQDQVFDILTLWAPLFRSNQESELKNSEHLSPKINVFSAAIDALTSFIRCFLHSDAVNTGVLLQPVLFYLSRAISYTKLLAARDIPNIKSAVDVFIIRTLIAYQSLPDPSLYKSEHAQIIQICSTPIRNPSGCEESSSLTSLLDKRDAWLGPSIPGRDWFEDELRTFQGGTDGLMPCVWDNELSSFPKPETIGKTLVNQMLLCFGVMFATQDNAGMLSILSTIDQCLKSGKKQPWRSASVTNICVGLLAGLKSLLSLRYGPLGSDVLLSLQAIFQGILVEGDTCASQRRAASECLGLIARLGNDVFTARMTRLLLGDITSVVNSNYAGSIAMALGCIHRSAGGMALSSLVPLTVTSISSLARSSVASLQTWSLHGLLLTIEAAGLSYASHVQEALGLALDILLHDDNGLIDLQQGVGRLINAIVAVLGPELSPGSIFFSRCKSVISEISSCQETATLLESVRFTQQLILFAPQAVSVQTHVQNLLRTLSSRQPILRHLAVSTIRHLVEKDPDSIINEQIEDSLFHMLDEETDSEITSLVRNTIMRLLYASCPSCPSRWIHISRAVVLATVTRSNAETVNSTARDHPDGKGIKTKEDSADDETMVSSYEDASTQNHVFGISRFNRKRDKHLRFRTRTFAAECLRHLLRAVGSASAHFDLSLAREAESKSNVSGDWLVLHVHELISLAYQISTIQLEHMQPIGVDVLSAILDKFEMIQDPELPGHLLLEQYQAQLVSAVRTALDISSGPILLETGLRLATKILTSGIISGDQASVKRIYALISRPLDEFENLYYPSFAEWVSCKIKIRLLAAHASLKCYSYTFLKKRDGASNEYSGLLPLFSKSSSILGKYWVLFLRDFSSICCGLQHNKKWMPFLDGMKSPLACAKLTLCLEEAWPLVFQAVSLDAVPANVNLGETSTINSENRHGTASISGYNMVSLEPEDYQFLFGFALLILFEGWHPTLDGHKGPESAIVKFRKGLRGNQIDIPTMKVYEIVLPVLQFLSTASFFRSGYLNANTCQDLVQILSYFVNMDDSWNSLAIPVLLQIVQNCPKEFLATHSLVNPVMELCVAYLYRACKEIDTMYGHGKRNELLTPLLATAKALVSRLEPQMQLKSMLVFLLIGYESCQGAGSESIFASAREFINDIYCLFKNQVVVGCEVEGDALLHVKSTLTGCLTMISKLTMECKENIYVNQMPKIPKLLQMKLAFYLEHAMSYAELAYRIGCNTDSGEIDISFLSCLKHSSAVLQVVLADSNIQVRAIALQMLYSMTQKSTTPRSSFYLFYMCELSSSIFHVLVSMMKEPATRENMAVANECVRMLVLLHSLSKDSKCERGLINLLLEGIVVVLSASENDISPDIVDVRSLSIKIVSHLAQSPSSSALFKDVLLTMPVSRRQQLQDTIRASMNQNQVTTQSMSSNSPLIIKLPVQSGENKVPTPPLVPSEKSCSEEEEEEDDWDTFQSFPATTALNADPEVDSNADDPMADDDWDAQDNDALQSSSATVASNADTEAEFHTEEPSPVEDSINDKYDALQSFPSSIQPDADAEAEEDPAPVDNFQNENYVTFSTPATSETNVDAKVEEPTSVNDFKNDDANFMQSSPGPTSEADDPTPVDDFKEDNIEALQSPIAEAEEPTLVEGFKNNDTDAMPFSPTSTAPITAEGAKEATSPSVPELKDEDTDANQFSPTSSPLNAGSVAESSMEEPMLVNDLLNNDSEKSERSCGSLSENSVSLTADEEHNKAGAPSSESPASASVVPELHSTNEESYTEPSTTHQIQYNEESGREESHPASPTNLSNKDLE